MLTKLSSKLLTFCFFAISIAFVSCDNKIDDVIPLVEVNVRINTLSAEYIDLQNVSGRAIIKNEGYMRNGIIVFRASETEFKAYDCTCTYEVSDTCAVVLDENNIAGAKCMHCNSKFELINCGMPTSGKAMHSLKNYRVRYSEPYLIIRN